ncbi:MAG: hypothetical protein FJ279_20080, partial [Planctomycetes bacterium]|nr:hypothetical protein [Planctomycetota bacterium]
QTLRHLGCRFDLIPDGLLTAERLAPFKLVIAPSCGVGFSQEARAALLDWARGGQDRRLAVSADAKLATALGLKKLDKAALSSETGGDLNVFVDIGAESDEPFVVEGFSQRENWGKLPKGAFGEGTNATMRWTPGVGRATTLMLPFSPNREHALRLQGSALWPNHAVVRLDGAPAAEFDVKPGFNEYEVTLPASKVGGRKAAAVTFEYATAHVPREQDPKRFPNEARVCNLALDYVQLSTSNMPARLTEQRFDWPKATIAFANPLWGSLNGRTASIRWQPHDSLASDNATILSTYTTDGAPRDILLRWPNSEVIYANGLFSEVGDAEYWRSLLANWAKTPAEEFVKGDDVMSARLSAGDTQIVLAANYDIIKPKDIQLAVSAPLGLPLSEARLLAKDGSAHAALQADVADGRVRLKDRLGYYAVYQFAFSPVRLTVPELVAQPGETREFAVTAANISQAAVSGTIQVKSVIPTIVGEPVRVSLKPGEAVRVKLPLTVKDTADWGRKTVVIELSFNGRTAYLWRELVVQRNPQLRLAQPILDARKPILSLENTDDTFSRNATAQQVVAHLDGVRVRLADIPSGTRVDQPLDKVSVRSDERAMLVSKTLTVEHQVGAKTAKTTFPAHVAAMPGAFPAMKGALLPVVAFNPGDARECELAASGPSKGVHVRVADGRAVPSQPDGDGRTIFHAVLPPSSATTFYLCDGPSPAVKTDLSVSADALGTGRGKVTVRNSHLEVTLDEAKGGTVTRLKSLATGLDYAAESLGVSYGSFSHYDPTHPATNTVNFIHESKARQASTPGRITLLADGPVQAQVRVEWQDALVSVVQTYWFSAFQDYFRLRNEVKPKKLGDAEELVALDARFAVNKLTKSYPNFVGIRETKEQPHFGWRMGPWVPDYLTLMTPPRFEESLSLIVTRKQGVDSVRQGFWPRERPKAGPCEFAQIELISSTRSDVDLEVYVKLHEGHQIVAKRSLESLRQPPLVCPESNPKWAGTAREPVLTPADWLFPFHAYRAPVKVSGAKSGVVTATIDFASALGGAKLDANSVRVAEESVERPCAVHPERQAVQWQADGGAGGTRLFHVYFDALDAGPKPISRLRRTFALDQLIDEGF